jgi:hypothetical protein
MCHGNEIRNQEILVEININLLKEFVITTQTLLNKLYLRLICYNCYLPRRGISNIS